MVWYSLLFQDFPQFIVIRTVCRSLGAMWSSVHRAELQWAGAKAFDYVDHNKLWKILKEMEYQTTWPASWETGMQVRKQQSELGMEQQTGSK